MPQKHILGLSNKRRPTTTHLICRDRQYLNKSLAPAAVQCNGAAVRRTRQPLRRQTDDVVRSAVFRLACPVVLHEVQHQGQPGVQLLRVAASAPIELRKLALRYCECILKGQSHLHNHVAHKENKVSCNHNSKSRCALHKTYMANLKVKHPGALGKTNK